MFGSIDASCSGQPLTHLSVDSHFVLLLSNFPRIEEMSSTHQGHETDLTRPSSLKHDITKSCGTLEWRALRGETETMLHVVSI